MIGHLKIQNYLMWSIFGITIFLFVSEIVKVKPSGGGLGFSHLLPVVILVIGAAVVIRIRNRNNAAYREFLEHSPSIDVDTASTKYGISHPAD